MKKRNKIVAILLVLVMATGVFAVAPIAVSAAAKDWAGGDCVTYARARFQEVYGFELHWPGDNARGYYTNAGDYGDTTSGTPVVGCLAVWDYGNTGFSHVAFVEEVSGNSYKISEGGYDGHYNERWFTVGSNISWTDKNGVYYYQTFLGFVYVSGAVLNPTIQGHEMLESEAAGRTIPDGNYWISSRIASNYFIDIPGNYTLTENGANAQMCIWNTTPGAYDVFHIEYQNNGFYQISQMNSNQGLDIQSGSMENGANIHLWEKHGGTAHQWSIEKNDKGYLLRSRRNSFCMDVAHASYETGTNLQTWTYNDTDSQYFALIPFEPNEKPLTDGIYMLSSALNQSLFLDAPAEPNSFSDTTNLQLWENAGEKLQIEYAGDGYYRVFEPISNLAVASLNNEYSYLNAKKNVLLATKGNGKEQLWKIKRDTDGFYYFINKMSGYYMDVSGGSSNAGANIQVYPYNGSTAQKWKPIRVLQDDMVQAGNIKTTNYTESITPEINVIVDTVKLAKDLDYTVEITTNTDTCTGTVTITGINNYCGKVVKSFHIFLAGDINLDTSINIKDVTALQRYSAELETFNDEQVFLSDTNGDGVVNINDATHLQQYLAEFDVTLG